MLVFLRSEPLLAMGLSEDELLHWVHDGIADCAQHHIETEYEVSLYIQCMLRLGSNFYTHPQPAWATVLRDMQGMSTTAIMHALLEIAHGDMIPVSLA